MINIVNDFLKYKKINKDDLLNCYLYGSRVYGTADEKSDYDFILVINNAKEEDSLEGIGDNANFSIYSPDSFQEKLTLHKINALECFFLPNEHILKKSVRFDFKLNKSKLREVISEKCSHSWVKAKKKFEIVQDKDIYRGKKSLFHSLRIADFGIQIASKSKIENYGASNHLWKEIAENESEEWEDYEKLYKQKFNQLMTEFRKVCPK